MNKNVIVKLMPQYTVPLLLLSIMNRKKSNDAL